MAFPIHVRFLSFVAIIFLNTAYLSAQESSTEPLKDSLSEKVVINNVIIIGNKTTRANIIRREMTFREGDTLTLKDFQAQMIISRQNIYNTRLFNFVTIGHTRGPASPMMDVSISVVEKWYIWPIPFFDFADRNFNVWFETRDISRFTYGIDLTFFNVRGRNETIKLLTHLGYNQLYGVAYQNPGLNDRQTIGIKLGAWAGLNHEIAVLTRNNKPVFVSDGQKFLQEEWYAFLDFSFRPDYFNTNSFSLRYNYHNFNEKVDTIPGFVISPEDVQQYVSMNWFFRNDHRDARDYPLKGYMYDLELNVSVPDRIARNSYLQGDIKYYGQIHSRFYCSAGFSGKLTFARTQPYYNQQGLGYGRDYVRGYEYYVVDGQHYALLKSNLKFALVPQRTSKIGFVPSQKFNEIPWAVYLTGFTDLGYVYHYNNSEDNRYSTGNTLENSMLIGYGFGIDFAAYYDIVIRIEAARNGLGQTGIFLHFTTSI